MITQRRTGQSSTQTHILLITIKSGKFLMVLFVVVIIWGGVGGCVFSLGEGLIPSSLILMV